MPGIVRCENRFISAAFDCHRMVKHLLFDLDGTMIDSSASILASFAEAFEKSGIKPAVPLSPILIGPPVRQTLARIAGSDDIDLIDRLFQLFREDYDNQGYLRTLAYPGIDGVLRRLSETGKTLFVVTNKRVVPTTKILRMFGWVDLFKGIHALDTGPIMFSCKADMIRYLLQKYAIDPATAVLVGDTTEDAEAAHANNLPFHGVAWGYGGLTRGQNLSVLGQPAELLVL
jgi:phosphoglycolate phosphatase